MRIKHVLKRSVLGAIAGLASTYVMTKFQTGTHAMEEKLTGPKHGLPEQGDDHHNEPSTEKLANKVFRQLTHQPIPENRIEAAGNLVHYGFGTSVGALYGLINTNRDEGKVLSGLLYGIGVWAIADNILVPLLGLSPGPFKKALKTQVYSLSAHLVYGGTLSRLHRQELRFT